MKSRYYKKVYHNQIKFIISAPILESKSLTVEANTTEYLNELV